jgi:hypothetical protein
MLKNNATPKTTDSRIDVFARAIHSGKSQSEAYRIMHPSSRKWKDETVYVKASIWSKTDKVQDKIAELRKSSAKRSETTIDTIDMMHRAAFSVAKTEKQGGAMTQAAQNLAKLHGLIVDKSASSVTVSSTESLSEYMKSRGK